MNQWAASMGFLRSSELTYEQEQEEVRELKLIRASRPWSPEKYAREQMRGLVRQVFFPASKEPIRHVALIAMEAEVDVRGVCRMVGDALASEDVGNVAVVGNCPRIYQSMGSVPANSTESRGRTPALPGVSRVWGNLWLVAGVSTDASATAELRALVSDVRREFDYSILQAPCVAASQLATAAAQLADGVILVLSERRTRRAAARHLVESMEAAEARILGAVLCDRTFPIPEKIYRRL